MSKQKSVHKAYLFGCAMCLILGAMIITDANTDNGLLARGLRLKQQPPAGDTNTVRGGVLVPQESSVLLEDPTNNPFPLIARFTKRIYFQIVVWEASQGTKDGDGIGRVEISINKVNLDTQESSPVYNHTEKSRPYCFFEGADPCGSINTFWPSGQPVENGQYNAAVGIYHKNSPQPAQWFFRFEINHARVR
jgi:hypothetical protein